MKGFSLFIAKLIQKMMEKLVVSEADEFALSLRLLSDRSLRYLLVVDIRREILRCASEKNLRLEDSDH